MKYIARFLILFLIFGTAYASTLKLETVTENVYAIIGELGNRTPDNLGNNSNFGFVVTNEGVVLIDSGATYGGAKEIETVVSSVTNQPIVKVINTGGQDHRWLGNNYFKNKGVEVIASSNAVTDQKTRLNAQLSRLEALLGDKLLNQTIPDYADVVFDDDYVFELGGVNFEIYHAGQAHTPGDSFIWLPQQSVMFTGDIVYVDRMLGVMDHSNSKSWISVFESMMNFKPEYIVPGHGSVTNLEKAKKDTYEYLKQLRSKVSDFMEKGGDAADIKMVDMTDYQYLQNFETLSGRNAQRVFTELEWE